MRSEQTVPESKSVYGYVNSEFVSRKHLHCFRGVCLNRGIVHREAVNARGFDREHRNALVMTRDAGDLPVVAGLFQ